MGVAKKCGKQEYQILSLDASYQFKYYNKICVPYFYVGFSVSIYNYDKVADDPFYSEYNENKFRAQLIMGTGLERELFNNFNIYADFRYEIAAKINVGLKYSFQ